MIDRLIYLEEEVIRLARELAEAKARESELERLCDATYVAKGADAYNHACELTEQWDAERAKKGKAPIYAPGEDRSLCGWIASIRQFLEDEEARAVPSWTETKFALDAWLKKKGIFDDDSKAVFAAAAWKACWDFVRANCSAKLPDGWVAVPENYTAEMRDAWDGAPVSEDLDIDFDRAYRAMIAARPKYPPNGLPKESGNG